MFARQTARTESIIPVVLLLALLAGCGGGGGGGNVASSPPSVATTTSVPGSGSSGSGGTSGFAPVTITPNVSSVSVSASTADAAPTATINITSQVTGAGTAPTQIFVGIATTHNAIASVSGTGGYAVNFTLTFKSPAPLGPGTYSDTITLYGCYDESCTQQVSNSPLTIPVTYTVTLGLAQITSISPTSTPAGGTGLTLQVNGVGFTSQSVVELNGTSLPTQYVSPVELDAQLSSSDVALVNIAAITVADSEPGGTPSPAAAFVVTGVSPTSVAAGGPGFLLTVVGEGFTSSSVAQWNGSNRPTTFVSANELRAQIGASDITSVGTASVSVQNGGSGAVTSGSVNVASLPPSKDAVAFQINPQHTGSISFNSVTLPAGAAWSVDVGGSPSYALIADGKVFVTSQTTDGAQVQGSLVALDQSTGAIAWGPIPIPIGIGGGLNAAYDSGSVFLSTGTQVQAYDAQTGALEWTASPPAATSFTTVVAANGLVIAGSDGNSNLATAFKEDTGLIIWQQDKVDSGIYPTVTVDGVYLGAEGNSEDLDWATGDLIWQNAPEYSSFHNAIAVAANGVLYSPNTTEFESYNGTEFDADTGSVLGGFNTYFVPAIGTQTGYFLSGSEVQGGTLSAVDLGSGAVLWTFTGDGELMSSPLLVNGYVFIGSASGKVYALNASSGSIAWQQNVGAAIPNGPPWGNGVPTSGLSAGDGLLVVPAGTRVTAYVLSADP
jgi:outer membrane protein assembly factor BamB